MPPHSELQEDVTQLQTTVYGAHGTGGIVRDVQHLQTKVEEHDNKLASMSAKWLILMLLAGVLGNSAGAALLSALFKTLTGSP